MLKTSSGSQQEQILAVLRDLAFSPQQCQLIAKNDGIHILADTLTSNLPHANSVHAASCLRSIALDLNLAAMVGNSDTDLYQYLKNNTIKITNWNWIDKCCYCEFGSCIRLDLFRQVWSLSWIAIFQQTTKVKLFVPEELYYTTLLSLTTTGCCRKLYQVLRTILWAWNWKSASYLLCWHFSRPCTYETDTMALTTPCQFSVLSFVKQALENWANTLYMLFKI